jgi:hypothetical protein
MEVFVMASVRCKEFTALNDNAAFFKDFCEVWFQEIDTLKS